MPKRISLGLVCLTGLLISQSAFAWFIWIPTGLIARAFETDPDSVVVSSEDRVLGKCAGLHANQARKFAPQELNAGHQSLQTGAPPPPVESPDFKFHTAMVEAAVAKATNKEKTKTLADAYADRWSRVAGADRSAAQTYGADLARSCANKNLPTHRSQYASWQAKEEQSKRAIAEEESKRARAEEERLRVQAEEEQKRASATVAQEIPLRASTTTGGEIDFLSEAKKSAHILGCPTSEVKVSGTDGKNVLFSAACGNGQFLHLACDQTGLCLKR